MRQKDTHNKNQKGTGRDRQSKSSDLWLKETFSSVPPGPSPELKSYFQLEKDMTAEVAQCLDAWIGMLPPRPFPLPPCLTWCKKIPSSLSMLFLVAKARLQDPSDFISCFHLQLCCFHLLLVNMPTALRLSPLDKLIANFEFSDGKKYLNL